jgi:hypothetical protein
MEKIGHHQKSGRRIKNIRRVFLPGMKLIEGIELQKLQPCFCKNISFGDSLKHLFHGTVGAGITIVIGHSQNFFLLV